MLNSSRRPVRGAAILLLLFFTLALFLKQLHHILRSTSRVRNTGKQSPPSVAIVVASQMKDNTSWVTALDSSWSKYIYLADNPNATLTVPQNKGREAMTYFTYIIDHYNTLSDITIFHHATQFQWHNDDPDYNAQRALSRLQLDHVLSEGYANLRCVWTIGCPPDGITPIAPLSQQRKRQQPGPLDGSKSLDYRPIYHDAFREFFPDLPVPERINAPCCAQFAVTAETVWQRPKREYEKFRRWLVETELRDDVSGRVMEYFWHLVFHRPAINCPGAQECYCNLYGKCNLTCESGGVCAGQWQRPYPGLNSHGQW